MPSLNRNRTYKNNNRRNNNNNNNNNNTSKRLHRGVGSRHLPLPHHVKFSRTNYKKKFPNTFENVEYRKSVSENTLHKNNPDYPYNNELLDKMMFKKNINTYRGKILKNLKNKGKIIANNT